MKTTINSIWKSVCRFLSLLLLCIAANGIVAASVQAQLYVGSFRGVGQYSATTGAAINASFIATEAYYGMALSGNTLFVANVASTAAHFYPTIGSYNATTGAAINSNLVVGGVNGLGYPAGIAVLGNTLFVADTLRNKVISYDATTGTVINANFITSLTSGGGVSPMGLALASDTLFVVNQYALSGFVASYNALGSLGSNLKIQELE